MQVQMLFSDSFQTKFLQGFDVFEESKVVIRPVLNAEVVDDFGESHIEAILAAVKDQPYSLVAIFDLQRVYYRDPKVKTISNGEQWVPLDQYLSFQTSG